MKKMLKLAMMVAALVCSTQTASADQVSFSDGRTVSVSFTELCKLAKTGQTAYQKDGVTLRIGISSNKLTVGNLAVQSCKGKKSNKIGGGGSATSTSFTEDTSPTTTRPEPIGDGAPGPVGDGDGVSTPDTDVGEAPSPAGDGEPATENGNERPTQGGDVDGFGADNSPTHDAPAPAGG